MIDRLQRRQPERPTPRLESLVREIEQDPLLLEPDRLRQRLDALDRLDVYLAPHPAVGAEQDAKLHRRARAISSTLEAVNAALYNDLRQEIQRSNGPNALLRWLPPPTEIQMAGHPPPSIAPDLLEHDFLGYDFLDELISGVLQIEDPEAPDDPGNPDDLAGAAELPREPEMVFYQPTPARHIFRLIALAALTATDVLVDLGSGLGHVPLLVSICTPASSVGIELQPAYVDRARECAARLHLRTATFLHQDARAADLSTGTVFYLHTPFTGSILTHVLALLQHEAARRPIRIYTYGPCTTAFAHQPWLEPALAPDTHRITLFRSRN